MIRSLFILNRQGEVLIEKHWRGNARRTDSDAFWAQASQVRRPEDLPPVSVLVAPPEIDADDEDDQLSKDRCQSGEELAPSATSQDHKAPADFVGRVEGNVDAKSILVHVYKDGLYFLATLESDGKVSPLLAVSFLGHIIDVFQDYFGEVNEHAIKDNFILVYELLDEMMDHGFPLTTEPNVLKEMLPAPSVYKKVMETVIGESSLNPKLPQGSLSIVPWRKSNVRYAQNEIFVDVNERLNAIVAPNGELIHMIILGEVAIKCLLSGMPDISVKLRMAHVIDDSSVHQCVRYSKYERDGVLSFVPPDGSFRLLDYIIRNPTQVCSTIAPPLDVRSTFKLERINKSWQVEISANARYGLFEEIQDVSLALRIPGEVCNVNLSATGDGGVHYDTSAKLCTWNVGEIKSDRRPCLTGTISFEDAVPEATPSILASFRMPSTALSGIDIESFHVYGENYDLYKGLRCSTAAGNYEYRTR